MIHLKPYLFFLLFCGQLFAQDSIYKTDGSKFQLASGSLKVDHRHKQLTYRLSGNDKEQTVAFKDLDKATSAGKQFKIFREKKRVKGYYVIAAHNGLFLAAVSVKKTSNIGGFNVPYVLHEMIVFDGAKIIGDISFTENNDRKNIKRRMEAKEMIHNHFADCVGVLERLAYFSNNESRLEEGDIVGLLAPALYIPCR